MGSQLLFARCVWGSPRFDADGSKLVVVEIEWEGTIRFGLSERLLFYIIEVVFE